MYKILLVDDEVLVRTNLKLLLQKFSPEFFVCGEASDGVSGLKQASLLHPDIIFTDMRMPNMDGVEFCRKIQITFPDISLIALSNYDDFTYVRGALKNGAVDYILKHKLSEEYLASILKDLKKTTPFDSNVEHLPENTLNVLREKFVANLMSNAFHSLDEIESNLKMLDIPLETTQVLPIILSIDNYWQLSQNSKAGYLTTLEFAILNIGNEILSQYHSGLLTHIEKENYCILLSFANIRSQARINEIIQSILQQLSANYKSFLNISSSFSVGEICNSIISINASYKKALETMQLKFYSGNHCILHSKDITISNTSLASLDYAIEKRLLALISTGNYGSVKESIDLIFQDMISKKVSIANMQMICTDLISIITRVSKKNSIPLDLILKNQIHPNEIFTELNTLIEVRDWFLESFKNLCEQINTQLPGDSNYVKSAIACINRDYSKSISQQSVADEIGISVGYLSTIFKSETGQGFSEYLTSVRIKTAAHMLDSGEHDLHKISMECGFQDYAYFFKVFKKKMGMTPKSYIKSVHAL